MHQMPQWSALQRKISWVLISSRTCSFFRNSIKTATTAFTLLHKYFSNDIKEHHRFYIVLASSVFLSGKIDDDFKLMKDVINFLRDQIAYCNKTISKIDVFKLMEISDINCFTPTFELIKEVCDCELQILTAINWNFEIDSPYNYVNDYIYQTPEIAESLYKNMIISISAMVQNKNYLEIPFSVIAAAALETAYNRFHHEIPEDAEKWIQLQKSISDTGFQYTLNIADKYQTCLLNDCLKKISLSH